MKIQIKHRWTGNVLFECEAGSLRLAVELAIKQAANLSGANLSAANLRDADLSGADLSGADLSAADLSAADLSDVSLSGADLICANLSGANLCVADLRVANLRDADLSAANLSGANLRVADLRVANLRGASLTPIRDDFWAVLSSAPAEVLGLRQALMEGRVDGSTYSGECACLVGTLANVRQCEYDAISGLTPDSDRPAERFFFAIHKGDTPENSQFAKLAVEWLDSWPPLAFIQGKEAAS